MQENSEAPLSSNLEKEQQANTTILASRWKRFWAAMIDSIIFLIIILPIMYFSGIYESIKEGQQNSFLFSASFMLIGNLLVKYG